MITQEQEAALVLAAQEGDEQAFRRLYEMTRPALRAYVCKRLRGTFSASDLSEDVVAETYLRAYRAFGLFKADRPVGAWLTVIARNVIHDHFRSARFRHESCTLEWVDEEEMDLFAPDPYEGAERAELVRRILKIMDGLTTQQRTALLCRYYFEWSQAELARAMGISAGAVSQLTDRGKRNVRARAGAVW